MVPNNQQCFRFLVFFAVVGQLSGCGAMGGAVALGALQGAVIGGMASGVYSPKPRPPKIFCSAEDSLGLTYGTAGSSASRDEAMQLISEHCASGHVETHRAYYSTVSEVFVACLQADGSPPQSPSCNYVAQERSPIGFGEL